MSKMLLPAFALATLLMPGTRLSAADYLVCINNAKQSDWTILTSGPGLDEANQGATFKITKRGSRTARPDGLGNQSPWTIPGGHRFDLWITTAGDLNCRIALADKNQNARVVTLKSVAQGGKTTVSTLHHGYRPGAGKPMKEPAGADGVILLNREFGDARIREIILDKDAYPVQ